MISLFSNTFSNKSSQQSEWRYTNRPNITVKRNQNAQKASDTHIHWFEFHFGKRCAQEMHRLSSSRLGIKRLLNQSFSWDPSKHENRYESSKLCPLWTTSRLPFTAILFWLGSVGTFALVLLWSSHLYFGRLLLWVVRKPVCNTTRGRDKTSSLLKWVPLEWVWSAKSKYSRLSGILLVGHTPKVCSYMLSQINGMKLRISERFLELITWMSDNDD